MDDAIEFPCFGPFEAGLGPYNIKKHARAFRRRTFAESAVSFSNGISGFSLMIPLRATWRKSRSGDQPGFRNQPRSLPPSGFFVNREGCCAIQNASCNCLRVAGRSPCHSALTSALYLLCSTQFTGETSASHCSNLTLRSFVESCSFAGARPTC